MVFVLSYKLMRNQIKKDEAMVIQISESHWRLYIFTYPSANENLLQVFLCSVVLAFYLGAHDILFYLITLYYSFHHGILFV